MHISGAHSRVLLLCSSLQFLVLSFCFFPLVQSARFFDGVSCCSSGALLSLMCRYFDERWLSERKSRRRRRKGGGYSCGNEAPPLKSARRVCLAAPTRSAHSHVCRRSMQDLSLLHFSSPTKAPASEWLVFPRILGKVKAACESVDSTALLYLDRQWKSVF